MTFQDPWYADQHRRRMEEDQARSDEARLARERENRDAFYAAEERVQRQSQAFRDGMNGYGPPLTSDMSESAQWAHGDGIRQQREAELRRPSGSSGAHADSHTPDLSGPIELDPIVRTNLEKDGLHGVVLNIHVLTPQEHEAFVRGFETFRDSISVLPAFMREGNLAAADRMVKGETYFAFQEFRTYHPVLALKRGFDGLGTSGSRISEGAAWCVKRGEDFGLAYRAYRQAVAACEAEAAKRDAMRWPRRELLNRLDPVRFPTKTSAVFHAEYLITVHAWLTGPEYTGPKTSAAL